VTEALMNRLWVTPETSSKVRVPVGWTVSTLIVFDVRLVAVTLPRMSEGGVVKVQ